MAEKCGDDLIAARRFMNLCRNHMSEMFSGGEVPMEDVVMRLSEIQSQAKLMRARYIYKSAQTVIDDLTRHRSPTDCASSVLVLQKLINQYESGLSEIAPQISPVVKSEKTNPVGPAIVSELTRQIETARTLVPLIKYANKEDRPSLFKLVNLAANRGKADSKTQVYSRKNMIPRAGLVSDLEQFDVILPALTNGWLREARSQGKSISVSSACDDALVASDILNKIQSGLRGFGEILISESVGTPETLEAKGLSRSAHMAVTARFKQKTLTVLLSCGGQGFEEGLAQSIVKDLRACGLSPYLDFQEDIIRLEIRNIPARPAIPSEQEAVS